MERSEVDVRRSPASVLTTRSMSMRFAEPVSTDGPFRRGLVLVHGSFGDQQQVGL